MFNGRSRLTTTESLVKLTDSAVESVNSTTDFTAHPVNLALQYRYCHYAEMKGLVHVSHIR